MSALSDKYHRKYYPEDYNMPNNKFGYPAPAGPTLGDILGDALKRNEFHITVEHRTECVKVTKHTMVLRPWMQIAMRGEKINAIRALREETGLDQSGYVLGLKHAKTIVEAFINGIRTDVTYE